MHWGTPQCRETSATPGDGRQAESGLGTGTFDREGKLISITDQDLEATEPPATRPVAEMAPLVRRVRALLEGREQELSSGRQPPDPDSLARVFHFRPRKQGGAEIILADETARELGHPATASRALLLMTFAPDLVCHGRVSLLGPDLKAMESGKRYPFAQIVLLAVKPGQVPDPFELENAQFLMNRLPGYMVRSVPGRLWVRISKQGLDRGLTLPAVGAALVAVYAGEFPGVEKAEVIFITSTREDVEALDPIAAEADILSGRHKKLVLGLDGAVECRELTCETCEEKPACDSLRDVVIKHRQTRRETEKK